MYYSIVTFIFWALYRSEIVLAACPNNCSNHGLCSSSKCTCFHGFTGSDCSRRHCNVGRAWFDVASATDVAHQDNIECSGMGFCDQMTGICRCRPGFSGWACERMDCPKDKQHRDCNGHGTCTTMREAAEGFDGYRLINPSTTYSLWDADKIMGCICDEGCAISYNATQAEVETAIEAMNTIDFVTLSWSIAVCGSDSRTLAITFNSESGDIPDLIANSESTDISLTVTEDTKGTKENAPCNNRGFCTTDRLSEYGGTYINGKGELGNRGDCGVSKPGVTIANCPLSSFTTTGTDFCAGHGVCDSTTKVCTCYPGWKGHNCELRKCPLAKAWFDEATGANTAHALAECAARGTCDVRKCSCQDGFEGADCSRLACPMSASGICGGVGRCISMRDLASANGKIYGATGSGDTVWDADMMYGCNCDQYSDNYNTYAVGGRSGDASGTGQNFFGYNCSRRQCRSGPQLACNGSPTDMEAQTIVCSLTAGSFTLSFSSMTTSSISFDATAATLRTALIELSNIGDVNVTFSAGTSLCTSGGTNTVTIDFLTEYGDVCFIFFQIQFFFHTKFCT
eukprot:GSMAST32.ASY1.ANO1.2073.1 assembled CDS